MTSRAQTSLMAARKNLEAKRDKLVEKITDLSNEINRIDAALEALGKKP